MKWRPLARAALGFATAALWPAFAGATEPERPPRAEKPSPEKPSPARATVEVLVLHATNAKRGIDPKLRDLPELTKAPFSSYDSYSIVDQVKLVLEKATPQTHRLPNGRVLKARLLDVLGDEFVRLSASINQPGGADFLPLLEVKAKFGQRFIVAGQRYKSGILVLVIRVLK